MNREAEERREARAQMAVCEVHHYAYTDRCPRCPVEQPESIEDRREARAEQLIDAVARALYELSDPIIGWGERLSGDDAAFKEGARAALNVVRTEREQITCPTCDGQGGSVTEEHVRFWGDGDEWSTVLAEHTCETCQGARSVPGELLVVGLIGGEDAPGKPWCFVRLTDDAWELASERSPGAFPLYRKPGIEREAVALLREWSAWGESLGDPNDLPFPTKERTLDFLNRAARIIEREAP